MNSFIKKIFKNKRINLILALSMVFVSLLSLFPIGALNSSTVVEETSEYLADVTQNHTINRKYTAMMIEPKDGSDKKINNPYIEFHYLYGIFREGLATYVGSVNADKSHNIKLKDIEEDVNFSFLNVDSGFGVKEYYKDKTTGEMVYKQEFYPLELMFYSNHPMVTGAYSFLYISQSRANDLLDKWGYEHTKENYQKILNNPEYLITLEFDGVEYKFAIDNIYYERNYFYDALNEVMGEFFLAGQKYPSVIKRQGMFFLRNYAYQNQFYIRYATSLYSQSDFTFKVLERNFVNGFKINESKLVYTSSANRDVASVVLLVLAILVLIASLLLMYFGTFEFKRINHLLVGGAAILPYVIFWIIHLISKSVLLFSSFSTIAELWCLVGFVAIYLFLFLIKRKKKEVTSQ